MVFRNFCSGLFSHTVVLLEYRKETGRTFSNPAAHLLTSDWHSADPGVVWTHGCENEGRLPCAGHCAAGLHRKGAFVVRQEP